MSELYDAGDGRGAIVLETVEEIKSGDKLYLKAPDFHLNTLVTVTAVGRCQLRPVGSLREALDTEYAGDVAMVHGELRFTGDEDFRWVGKGNVGCFIFHPSQLSKTPWPEPQAPKRQRESSQYDGLAPHLL